MRLKRWFQILSNTFFENLYHLMLFRLCSTLEATRTPSSTNGKGWWDSSTGPFDCTRGCTLSMIVTLQTHGESEEMVQSGNSGGAAEAWEEIPWALHKVSTFCNLILREMFIDCNVVFHSQRRESSFFQLWIQSMIAGMVYHWWKNSSLVGSREGTAASNSSKPSSSPPGSISVQKSTFAHELGAGKCRTCAATASWPPLSRWPTTCPWSRGPLNLKKTVSASASPFFFLERGSP